jgi:hypothetical protein
MTDHKIAAPPVVLYLRVAFIVPCLVFLTGTAVGLFIWVTQGPDATMFFPARGAGSDIAAPWGTALYGFLAAIGIFGALYVPRMVTRRASGTQTQRDQPSE